MRDNTRALTDDENLTLQAVAKTLRQAAFWGLRARDQGMLLRVAEEVEMLDADALAMCCPVCEETTCDGDCPLAEMRA